MSLSAAKATHGLVATFTAAAPSVSWTERIGGVPENVSLPNATHGYELSALLGGVGDYLTLGFEQGTATVTGSGTSATGTLTLTGNAVADETVTVGAKTYTWKATVATTANQVKIGASASDSLDNLIAAINAGAGSGTVYGSATTANAAGTASAGTGDTMVFTAAAVGTSYNSTATTETMTNGSWATATLAGGVNASTLTGGDGKDNEGEDIPGQGLLCGLRIRCIAGEVGFNAAGDLVGGLGVGGVLMLVNPVGSNIATYSPIVITANTADSTVSVEVLSVVD